MKPQTALFLIICLSILLSSCSLNLIGSTKLEDPFQVTEQERQRIQTIAGETEDKQEEYIQSLNQILTPNNSLETLEQELEETVILEEDFSDLLEISI